LDDRGVQNRPAQRLEFGSVVLVPDESLLLKDGRPVPLTPKAFDLLTVLASNPGRLLTKDELMQAVWPDAVVEESNLASNISAIRRALGEGAEGADGDRLIETVPKRGYRFVAAVSRIEDSVVATGAPQPTRSERRWGWRQSAVIAVATAALSATVLTLTRPAVAPNTDHTSHFQIPVPSQFRQAGLLSVSPDGRYLVFSAEGADGVMRLWVRPLNAVQPFPLPGTEVFTSPVPPPVIWSPDSRFVAVSGAGRLQKVDISRGGPQPICDLPGDLAVGGSWNDEGTILVGNPTGGVLRCSASGGKATVVTVPESAQEFHLFPALLPDGRHFIYTRISRTRPDRSGVFIGNLASSSTPTGEPLISTGFVAAFVPGSDTSLIVYARNGTLFAQPFDERQLRLSGEPIRLAGPVGSYLDGASFSVSPTTLVYRAPEPDFQLTWFDRAGRELARVGEPGRLVGLALSPDDRRALVAKLVPQNTMDQDVWLVDVSRNASARKMTWEPTLEVSPVWAGNDRFVVGSTGGGPGMYQRAVGGERQLLVETLVAMPTSATTDLQMLLYTRYAGPETGFDVWMHTHDARGNTTAPLVRRESDQWQAELSPDRRWIAYVSNENGRNEVFVAELETDSSTGGVVTGDSIPISNGGGFAPRWRGHELFYLTAEGSVMAVDVSADRELRPGVPRRLFGVPGVIPEWGVAKDGARFLFAKPVASSPPFDVVLNWREALTQ
jgi:eukaryotic-like serine/threonine-protein kinase